MNWVIAIVLLTSLATLVALVLAKDGEHRDQVDTMIRAHEALLARVLQQTELRELRHVEEMARMEATHDNRVERLITALLEPDERLSIAKLEIEAHKAVAIAESKAKVAEHIGPAEVARRLEAERYAERYEDVGAER